MKSIIYISYQFPPNISSNSIRNFQVVNNLGEKYKVHVVTVNKQQDWDNNEQLSRLNSNVTISRTEMGVLHRNYYKDNNANINGEEKRRSFKKKIISNLKKIGFKLKELLLIPDPVIDWYPHAKKEIKSLIKDQKPEYIISSASPYTSHLVGHYFKLNYDLPHIMIYGDPWVYETSRKRGIIRFYMEKFWESKILKSSDHIFTVTNTTRDLYLEKFNIDKEKISVIRSGFDPKDFTYDNSSDNNDKLNMIYGGSLNPVHRNPLPFFKAIERLPDNLKDDINFNLFTNETIKYDSMVNKLNIQSVVNVKKPINYNSFVRELEINDVLVLFGNSSSLQVPGKVYDYIGSLSRILFISNNENYINDPTYKIISSYSGNYHCKNEEEVIYNKMVEIYNLWKENKLTKHDYSHVKEFTWKYSVQKLVNYIN